MLTKSINVYPVPWDLTSTFKTGSNLSPNKIEGVIHQLDDYHPFTNQIVNLSFKQVNPEILRLQNTFVNDARRIISGYNKGETLSENDLIIQEHINKASNHLNTLVMNDLNLSIKHPTLLCGGEHGVGLGFIRALAKSYSSFSILQIDAHMDCYPSYFGFNYSHASVMTHYAAIDSVHSITQVGVRDFSKIESDFQASSTCKFNTFLDYDIHKQLFNDKTWHHICDQIINTLDDNVFISFDVDGLMPYLSMGSGTPVAGGLSYNQLVYLFDRLVQSHQIIGAELVEVNSSDHDDFNIIVGAKLLQLLGGCFA